MREILEIVAQFIVEFFSGAIAGWLGRAKPLALERDTGAIRPDRWSASFTVFLFAALSLWMLYISVWSNGGWPFMIASFALAAIAGCKIPSLTNCHLVGWKAGGVAGPSTTFGLDTSRSEIDWRDIARVGKTLSGYWFIESRDARRIYWSYAYRGHNTLKAALKKRCPTLNLNDLGY